MELNLNIASIHPNKCSNDLNPNFSSIRSRNDLN
jgi:hypothetical protein